MKNKTFLNKMEELKPHIPVQLDVERKLLPRLKFMGYVMFVCCLASVAFAIFAPKEQIADFEVAAYDQVYLAGVALGPDEDPLELSPTEVFNFYLIGLVFASVGAACFLTAWKKKRSLFK